ETVVGRQRQGAGGDAVGALDDELQARLDPEARRRGARPAARCDGRDPAAAHQGAGQQQAAVQQAAEGDCHAARGPAGRLQPTDPNTVYVPYYARGVVYGAWPYSDYQPYYFGAPGYIAAGVIATGIAFGAGYALGRWGNSIWGGGVNWGNRNIIANRTNNINISGSGNNWVHNPAHRGGVRYNNANVQQRFGNNNVRTGANPRMDFRGRGGDQVLKPGGDRGNLADRGGANRPGGDRGATNRPGGADRGNVANRGNNRPSGGAAQRPAQRASSGGARRDTAFGNVQSGRVTNHQTAPGPASPGGAPRGGKAGARGSRRGRGRGGGGWQGPGRRWRRLPWRWWRAALRHCAQARHRAARPPRQRPRLLPLCLQRQPHRLCGRDGAGGPSRHAAGGHPRARRLSA